MFCKKPLVSLPSRSSSQKDKLEAFSVVGSGFTTALKLEIPLAHPVRELYTRA